MQELPSALQTDPLWVDFTYENHDYEDAISLIQLKWENVLPVDADMAREGVGRQREDILRLDRIHPPIKDPE
ncbi:hypothetical protein NL676_021500 [Syzygium grande]|nr:hypothetical protein NL676_021500 [Syzygium grande]